MSESTDRYIQILKKYWGYDNFRGIQREIVESIGSGKDTLGLMPTGGGKSITFQVPALAMEGVCIVVTPLISLMKDQVDNLRRRGVMAAAVYSGMTRDEVVATLENCILGHTKLLYVSPERLASDLFRVKLGHMKVSFITVDEAHCISQWGYDFRPSYLQIAQLRDMKPGVPVLALTATATPEVVDDIQDRLRFSERNVFRMSFERSNLAYVVRTAQDKKQEMLHILRSVPGSAIVYVRSRRRCREVCDIITEAGIKATFYHAGLEHYEKDERQRQWHDDEVRVMVATNAFGMGIDKPDVRLVLHADCPNSLEAYFQEAGRAGRDGKKAYAVLLYNGHDERKMDKRIVEEFPDKQFIRDVYEHLAYFYQIALGDGRGHTFLFDITKFCQTFHHFSIQTNSALKILQRAGYIYYDMEPDAMARVRFLLDRDDLYRLDNSSADEDAVVLALLRHYSGLFPTIPTSTRTPWPTTPASRANRSTSSSRVCPNVTSSITSHSASSPPSPTHATAKLPTVWSSVQRSMTSAVSSLSIASRSSLPTPPTTTCAAAVSSCAILVRPAPPIVASATCVWAMRPPTACPTTPALPCVSASSTSFPTANAMPSASLPAPMALTPTLLSKPWLTL